jgi:hypothetical protein
VELQFWLAALEVERSRDEKLIPDALPLILNAIPSNKDREKVNFTASNGVHH